MSIMSLLTTSLLTTSILTAPRPLTGPKVQLIRIARDQRAQIIGLIVLMHAAVGRWMKRSRQRRALYEIAERDDHHLLKDIGVSREEAFREAGKPFWQQ